LRGEGKCSALSRRGQPAEKDAGLVGANRGGPDMLNELVPLLTGADYICVYRDGELYLELE
jgi:hypothetical protein